MLDNFFDLGGDSLKSIELVSELEDKGYTVNVKTIFEALNIQELAKQLTVKEEQETKKILASRLKELRIKKDIPQLMVALDLSIARSTYACYETGKNEPDIFTLIKIADYFDVSLDYLVGRTNNDEES